MKTIEVEYYDIDQKLRTKRIDIPNTWVNDPYLHTLITRKLKRVLKIKKVTFIN